MPNNCKVEPLSKLLYPEEAIDYISLDGEIIFFSTTRNAYVGVSGIGADILQIARRSRVGLRAEQLIDEITSGHELRNCEKTTILNDIRTLIELGALHEK